MATSHIRMHRRLPWHIRHVCDAPVDPAATAWPPPIRSEPPRGRLTRLTASISRRRYHTYTSRANGVRETASRESGEIGGGGDGARHEGRRSDAVGGRRDARGAATGRPRRTGSAAGDGGALRRRGDGDATARRRRCDLRQRSKWERMRRGRHGCEARAWQRWRHGGSDIRPRANGCARHYMRAHPHAVDAASIARAPRGGRRGRRW